VGVRLTGHGEDAHLLASVQKEKWEEDVREGYQLLAANYASIYLVGYSIGAALGLNILSDDVKFEKMILMAPAIAPRSYVKLLRYLTPIFPKFPLYSIAPNGYHANPYLPLKIYGILYELHSSLTNRKFAHANVPTIVVMDEKDETMDLQDIKKMIGRYGLNQWKLILLDSKLCVEHVKFHHLIVDEKAMGKKNWGLFVKATKRLLSS